MSKLDQALRLHKLLVAHRRPLPRKYLQERLECSEATIKRLIPWCRDILNMPIAYDRSANGYWLDQSAGEYEIPGLWFSQDEIHALVAIDHLLTNLAPGVVREEIAPFRKRMRALLHALGGSDGEIHRIRLLNVGQRRRQFRFFSQVAGALLQRRRLILDYHARDNDCMTRRVVSPQRLSHYRDNWYLAAWCHERNALRLFSLDRIATARIHKEAAVDIDESVLDGELASAYGIFAGKPINLAIVRFTARAARWVAETRWHPQQSGHYLEDGAYELHIPYSEPTELIGDILRFGPDAEVIAPAELRETVIQRIESMRRGYADG